jgi:hypothetical protein
MPTALLERRIHIMRTPHETLAAVQNHIQKYNSPQGGSCAASGVEMILKLEGVVSMGYYDLQDQYKYQNTGWAPFVTTPTHGFEFSSNVATRQMAK